MSHFCAFYSCDVCGNVIGGFISNTICAAQGASDGFVCFNPKTIKLHSDLKFYCKMCAPRMTVCFVKNCKECNKQVQLYYSPKFVVIENDRRKIETVAVKDITMESDSMVWCSVECSNARFYEIYGNNCEPPAPIFMKFQIGRGKIKVEP